MSRLDNIWELTPKDSVIRLDKWKTQMPNTAACLQTCYIIAGYETNILGAVQIYIESPGTSRVSNVDEANDLIEKSLLHSCPIIVGVYRTLDMIHVNNSGRVDHFVVIVGKGSEGGSKYYRFVDPGTAYPRFGIHPGNRFSWEDKKLVGRTGYGNHRKYTVSQIRPKMHF